MLEEDGQVLGFAYCQWFKPRPAYRFSAEDSIYLHPQACGRGLGRLLLAALADAAHQAGLRKLIAVIGDSANTASIGVHRAIGFESKALQMFWSSDFVEAEEALRIGLVDEVHPDELLMEKTLGDGDRSAPAQ